MDFWFGLRLGYLGILWRVLWVSVLLDVLWRERAGLLLVDACLGEVCSGPSP